MKRFLCILFALCAGLPLYAQTTLLPQFFDNGNAGTEYYMTFLPTWPVAGGINNIKIYVSSAVETEVVVEVKADGYVQKKKTKPNDIIEFALPVTVAQPYFKNDRDPTPKEAIYKQKAVHLTANDPVIVYGVTRYQYTSDGFLALPVSALGTEYIIASFFDIGDNGISFGQYMPSEAGIVAAFDNTKVYFTLGGNPITTTPGGMKPGETKTFTLNKGDVLSLASSGQKADLSGSKVNSDKPVGVISGNFCAYIPNETTGYCDHLVEMELPTHTWGKEYIVPKIFGRKKNSVLKIMAKEPSTKIFINGQHKNTIAKAGGVEGSGYIVRRPDEGSPANFVISADKPICVTQFNSGQDDDGVASDPFQLVLTPVDHFMKDLTFTTPGIGDGSGFAKNYVNLVFELDENGEMPEGLEFAVVTNNEFEWTTLREKFGSFFETLPTEINDKQYGVKTIKLSRDGVYRFRSPFSLAAYSYGFSDYDSYGYPAGASLADLSGGVDTLPPVPVFTRNDSGSVKNGVVTDASDGWNSKLASVTLLRSMSYNYTMTTGTIIPGQSSEVTWSLTVANPTQPAKAVLLFIDRAGNDTTITVEFEGVKIAAIKTTGCNFGSVTVGSDSREKYVRIASTGTKDVVVTSVEAPSSASVTVDIPVVPFTISAGSYKDIPVHFEPRSVGSVNENIIFHIENLANAVATVRGIGRTPGLALIPVDFLDMEVGSASNRTLTLSNTDTEPFRITTLRTPTVSAFTVPEMPELPLVINPGTSYELPVRFEPADTGSYSDEILVGIFDFEATGSISGRGVKTTSVGAGADVPLLSMRELYPNPASEETILHYTLPSMGHVRLALFNTMGQEVLSLTDGVQTSGEYTVRIPTAALPPGMYVCRLTSGNTTVSAHLVVAH